MLSYVYFLMHKKNTHQSLSRTPLRNIILQKMFTKHINRIAYECQYDMSIPLKL